MAAAVLFLILLDTHGCKIAAALAVVLVRHILERAVAS